MISGSNKCWGEVIVNKNLSVATLPNMGDTRGSSFRVSSDILSFLGNIVDIHFASVLPGAVRGNHFHRRRREVLIVLHESGWRLHWDDGEGSEAQSQDFRGAGAEVLQIEPGSSHAVKNTGTQALVIIGLSPEPYDPEETLKRVLAFPDY